MRTIQLWNGSQQCLLNFDTLSEFLFVYLFVFLPFCCNSSLISKHTPGTIQSILDILHFILTMLFTPFLQTRQLRCRDCVTCPNSYSRERFELEPGSRESVSTTTFDHGAERGR